MANRAGPSRPIKRPPARPQGRIAPRQSAPAKITHDVIVIDSSEEESPKRPVGRAKSATSPTEAIQISSSSSVAGSPRRRSPKLPLQTSSSPLASSSQSSSRRVLEVSIPTRTRKSAPVHLKDLPPPPPSSDDGNQSSPIQPSQSTMPDPTAYRTSRPQPSSDADSLSSGEIVETELVTVLQLPGVVLGSSGSSTSSEKQGDHEGPRHGYSAPRARQAGQSSADRMSDENQTESETQVNLEASIANVSLYDHRRKPQDKQATDVVDQSSDAGGQGFPSGSDGDQGRFTCAIESCNASFTTAGRLHSHTSRDHGIKLSQKATKGKRKASDSPLLPSKRRAPLEMQTSSVRNSPGSAASSGSDRFVRRNNTIGFEPFVQKVSDQESPSPSDVPDADTCTNSDAGPSRPITPPIAPKMRAPHPNMRTAVPEQPSAHLSPLKQIAQTKDEVLIEGEGLVTWRVDLVNSMPESFRKNSGVRAVFEAYMDDAMRENEPCAPQVVVENEVDSEPCPPWEFVYYNRMVYGDNVPKPDLDALKGCDCLGPCNPRNKKCACVQRQARYFAEHLGEDGYSGFGCDEDGVIKYHGGAIFGCNSKCSCDLECSNKVLQQGRKYAISIKKTRTKGWGVFAKETIPAGAFIGVYTGELLTEGIVGKRSPVYDEFGRTYVLNIDFAHIRANKDAPTYAVDAFHAGNFTRFFNHSCQPNLFLTAYYCDDIDIQKPLLTLFCDRVIKAGQELTFSYTGLDVDDPEDQAKVQQIKRKGNSGENGKVFERCLCGAPRCFGIIFTGEG